MMDSKNQHSIGMEKESEYKIFNIETKRTKEEERKIGVYLKLRDQCREKYLGEEKDNGPLANASTNFVNSSQNIVKVYVL